MQTTLKLKLGGKERKFIFGLLFLGNSIERFAMDYFDLLTAAGQNMPKYIPLLMFESLKSSYEMDDETVDFTEKDVLNWLEACEAMGASEMVAFSNALIGSQENKTPEEEDLQEEVEDQKKK